MTVSATLHNQSIVPLRCWFGDLLLCDLQPGEKLITDSLDISIFQRGIITKLVTDNIDTETASKIAIDAFDGKIWNPDIFVRVVDEEISESLRADFPVYLSNCLIHNDLFLSGAYTTVRDCTIDGKIYITGDKMLIEGNVVCGGIDILGVGSFILGNRICGNSLKGIHLSH